MIINFSIENFRSINDRLTLSFEADRSKELEDYYIFEPKKGLRILKLGIIYGPNASGKTNVLRALDYLRQLVLNPLNTKTESLKLTPFLFDSDSRNKNTFFSLEFFQNGKKYLYNVELNNKAIVEESLYFHNPNKALVYRRTTDILNQVTKIDFGSKVKIPKEGKDALIGNTLWNNTVLGGYLKTNFESEILNEVIDWFKERLFPVVFPEADIVGFVLDKIKSGDIDKENVIKLLKKADFGLSNLEIKYDEANIDSEIIDLFLKLSKIPKDKIDKIKIDKIKEEGKIKTLEIFFDHAINNSEYLLPLQEESAGTNRYFQLVGMLNILIKRNGILPIDELESSLHPDLLKHFLLTFIVNSKNSQIITTTHHRELLLDRDILRKDVIWFTNKKKDGSTDLFSLADFDSSIIRNTSSIYNAYKIGKLGAVPNLGDYYIDFGNEKKR